MEYTERERHPSKDKRVSMTVTCGDGCIVLSSIVRDPDKKGS